MGELVSISAANRGGPEIRPLSSLPNEHDTISHGRHARTFVHGRARRHGLHLPSLRGPSIQFPIQPPKVRVFQRPRARKSSTLPRNGASIHTKAIEEKPWSSSRRPALWVDTNLPEGSALSLRLSKIVDRITSGRPRGPLQHHTVLKDPLLILA